MTTRAGELASKLADAIPAKEAYKDAVQPGARQIGTALGTVGHLLNSVLRPLQSLDKVWTCMFERLDGWLAQRLQGVPPSELTEPPPTVAGNVLTGLLFAQDEPDIREMFLNLLATSMVRRTKALAHPSFAGILKEMTPDEARIMMHIAKTQRVPVLRIRSRLGESIEPDGKPKQKCSLWDAAFMRAYYPEARCSTRRVLCIDDAASLGGTVNDTVRHLEMDYYDPRPWSEERVFTDFGKAVKLDDPESVPTYMDNFLRNRIANLYLDNRLDEDEPYKKLMQTRYFLVFKENATRSKLLVSTLPCMMTVTEFGDRFIRACIRGPGQGLLETGRREKKPANRVAPTDP